MANTWFTWTVLEGYPVIQTDDQIYVDIPVEAALPFFNLRLDVNFKDCHTHIIKAIEVPYVVAKFKVKTIENISETVQRYTIENLTEPQNEAVSFIWTIEEAGLTIDVNTLFIDIPIELGLKSFTLSLEARNGACKSIYSEKIEVCHINPTIERLSKDVVTDDAGDVIGHNFFFRNTTTPITATINWIVSEAYEPWVVENEIKVFIPLDGVDNFTVQLEASTGNCKMTSEVLSIEVCDVVADFEITTKQEKIEDGKLVGYDFTVNNRSKVDGDALDKLNWRVDGGAENIPFKLLNDDTTIEFFLPLGSQNITVTLVATYKDCTDDHSKSIDACPTEAVSITTEDPLPIFVPDKGTYPVNLKLSRPYGLSLIHI